MVLVYPSTGDTHLVLRTCSVQRSPSVIIVLRAPPGGDNNRPRRYILCISTVVRTRERGTRHTIIIYVDTTISTVCNILYDVIKYYL